MKILVAGGAGCLGSNLIEHLLPKGHRLHVIDNFATGKRELVPEVEGLSLTEGDIADASIVNEAFAEFQPDIVINSAASYKDPDNWAADVSTNVMGSINLIKASEAHQVKKIINFQTALCYGHPPEIPTKETASTKPFTSYGISKTAGEDFHLMSDIPTVSFRLANVTGPRLAIGPIPTFYQRLKDEKNCFCSDTKRDFLDMSDFLSLMDLALEDEEHVGIFNVSTGTTHSIKEIFDIVADYLGKGIIDVPIVAPNEDDVPIVCLDPTMVQDAFGWTPKVPFEEIIINQLKWYDKHGVSTIYSHLTSHKTE